MISTGFSLAVITTLGFMLIYCKLPKVIQKMLLKFPLATDIGACVLVYSFFGGTLVALFASAFVGLFVSFMLHIASNKEKYSYLYDFKDWIFGKAESFQNSLTEASQSYQNMKKEGGEVCQH